MGGGRDVKGEGAFKYRLALGVFEFRFSQLLLFCCTNSVLAVVSEFEGIPSRMKTNNNNNEICYDICFF
jgi:hypothetical protein